MHEYVYVDESGIHGAADFCLVAGYLGSVVQWQRFRAAWRHVLRQHHGRDGVVFHANDFFGRKYGNEENPWRSWSDKKADDYLDELLGVIRAHKIIPVGCAVDVKAFNTYTWGDRCVLAGYTPMKVRNLTRSRPAPYHLAVNLLIDDCVTHGAKGTDLHFVIAEQAQLQERALEGYTQRKGLLATAGPYEQEVVKRLKGMSVESPADFPALQAADLLANRCYNMLSHGLKVNKYGMKAMKGVAHARQDLPLLTAPFLEQMFLDAEITGEGRAALQALQEPS